MSKYKTIGEASLGIERIEGSIAKHDEQIGDLIKICTDFIATQKEYRRITTWVMGIMASVIAFLIINALTNFFDLKANDGKRNSSAYQRNSPSASDTLSFSYFEVKEEINPNH